MSLINQMLKDLEKRRVSTASPQGSVLQGVSWPGWRSDEQRGPARIWLLLIACVIAVAATVFWFQENARHGPRADVFRSTPSAISSFEKKVQREEETPAVKSQPENSIVMAVETAASGEPESQLSFSAPPNEEMESPVNDIETAELVQTAVLQPAIQQLPEVQTANNMQNVAETTKVIKKSHRLTAEEQADKRYRKALRYYREHQYALAESKLNSALEKDVAHTGARELLAVMLIKGGRYQEAGKVLADGLEMLPQHIPYLQLQARLLVEQGDIPTALQVLDSADPAIEIEFGYHAFRAALYQRNGMHDKAAEVYTRLVQFQGGNATLWMGLGISLEALGKLEPALHAFRRATASGGLAANLDSYVSNRIRRLKQRAAK